MAKQTKIEVVSEKNEKHNMRVKAAEFLEKKLASKRNEVSKKTYPVKGGLATAKALHDFIQKDAQWKFTESLGIIEAKRVLEEQVHSINGKMTSELALGALTIEALYYFMTKEEGKGYLKASAFVNNLLRPVSEALNASKADREEINQMERDLGTLQDAVLNKVGFEGEDSLLTEILDELAAEMNANE
jgi:hypothetical protein